MKKVLKITGFTIVGLLFFMAVLIVIASLSQKKIVDIALTKLSVATTVPVKINDLSFTLIKRFPYATFELSGVQIGQTGGSSSESAFEADKDMLHIESVFVMVKTIPLIKGEFEIIKIEIDGARVIYKIDSLGRSNIDFLLAKNDSTVSSPAIDSVDTTLSKPFILDLKEIKIKNTAFYYINDSSKITAKVFTPDFKISGKFIDMEFSAKMEGDLQFTNQSLNDSLLNAASVFIPGLELNGKLDENQLSGNIKGNLQLGKCDFGNTNLNRMEEATFNFNLDVDQDTLRIVAFNGNTEGAKLEATGKAALSENFYTNLVFNASDLDFAVLQKYIPDELINEFDLVKVAGNVNVSGTVAGNLSDSILPAVNLSFGLKNGNVKLEEYPEIKKINLKGTFTNGNKQNNTTSSVNFRSFVAQTDSSKLDLSISVSNFDKPKYKLNSNLNINLKEFEKLIPDSSIQNITGKIKAEFSTNGTLPDSIDNNFINLFVNQSTLKADISNFNITRDSLIVKDFTGLVIYNPGQIEINDLKVSLPTYQLNLLNSSVKAEFSGPISELQNMSVLVKSFNIESPEVQVWGSGTIQNLENPAFVLEASANLNLDKLLPFIPDSPVKSMSGNLSAEISTHGKLNLDSIAEQVNDIVFKQSNLSFDAKNVSISLPDSLMTLREINGIVKMENDTISISKMSGVAAGIDFSADSIKVVNVYKAVIKNQHETVFAKGNLEFGSIEASVFAPLFITDSVNENSEEIEPRNFLFELKGKIAAKRFEYEKTVMENVSAKFKVNDSLYIVDQFKANAFDGSSNSSIRFSVEQDGKQIVNVKNVVNRIDIKKFLFAFDNFGQDSLISYENVSGLFSTEMNSRFVLEAGTVVMEDTRVLGQVTLENGRLINYQPAMDVATFTGIKELDNIELKTLKSNIFLFKNQMYMPLTNVVSSSMDFSTFGMQSFGDNYEYHLQMHLRDALKGKSKKLFERQKDSGDEISKEDMDRNTIKIIYANMDGKQKTGFDTKKAQNAMTIKIQVQQKMLDLIFHPKLVSFETGVK